MVWYKSTADYRRPDKSAGVVYDLEHAYKLSGILRDKNWLRTLQQFVDCSASGVRRFVSGISRDDVFLSR
tara:strand:+ start:235 stop:444 length:210 start_codon:yes stop_codon:yes gene_type:complete